MKRTIGNTTIDYPLPVYSHEVVQSIIGTENFNDMQFTFDPIHDSIKQFS